MLDASDRPLKVIEIGASYGGQYQLLKGCKNLKSLVSIDPMYDWVPDVRPEEPFDAKRVDQAKLDSWERHVTAADINAHLLISKSHDAAADVSEDGPLAYTGMIFFEDADILIVDGCHHPVQPVKDDYYDFEPFMADEHIVIFDDIDHGDPQVAASEVEKELREAGNQVDRVEHYGGKVWALRVRRKA